MTEAADGGIAILGAGLSGLTLAAHLAQISARPGPIVLVDDGSRDIRTAAWASWSRRPGLLDTAAGEQFDRLRVHAGGRARTLALGGFRYRTVRGADLAALVHDHTEAAGDISFRTGHVVAVEDPTRPRVVLADGSELRPDWVFDARGVERTDAAPDAWLDFRGWRVRTELPHFGTEIPTLFDFRTAQDRAASFVYVLPTTAHRALVEHTSFAHPAAPPTGDDAHDEALGEYLSTVLGIDEGSRVIETVESARLPLSSSRAPTRRDGRIMTIGSAGGLLKASTGYAFQRIQRDSAAIARSFVRHGHPYDVPTPPARFAHYDRALLRAVVDEPSVLERAFAGLFDRASAEPILRFLDEDSTPWEEARLFASLPAAPLVRAMARRQEV
ncbi:MAG: lycopene cyclase family protein [Rhodococcus sp. (in: high G+C Gram-positive bacteria)]|uniref:lycopene cyclase family protein n=1 Tax=Rhodococcus sp. TaxID=1831 RepID=UPI003BB06C37